MLRSPHTHKVKTYTADQVERKQAKAVQFLGNMVGDDDAADDFEDMDLSEYAEHEEIEIVNSGKRSLKTMTGNGNGKTKQHLLDENADLKDQVSDLEDQAAINDILNPPTEEEEDEDEDDCDDGDYQN